MPLYPNEMVPLKIVRGREGLNGTCSAVRLIQARVGR